MSNAFENGDPLRQTHPKRPPIDAPAWGSGQLVALVGLAATAGLLIPGIFYMGLKRLVNMPDAQTHFVQWDVVVQMAGFAAMGWLLRRVVRAPKARTPRTAWLPAAGVGVVSFWMAGLVTLCWLALLTALRLPRFARPPSADDTSIPLLSQLFAVALLAPLAEEYFFRGALQETLQRATGSRTLAVTVISVLFALAHSSMQALPALFLLAVAMGTVASLTGSWRASAVAHMLYNVMVLLFTRYGQAVDRWFASQPLWLLLPMTGGVLALLAAGCWACFGWRRVRRLAAPAARPPWLAWMPLGVIMVLLGSFMWNYESQMR